MSAEAVAKAMRLNLDERVQDLIDWFTEFTDFSRIKDWVDEHGGWVSVYRRGE